MENYDQNKDLRFGTSGSLAEAADCALSALVGIKSIFFYFIKSTIFMIFMLQGIICVGIIMDAIQITEECCNTNVLA